MSAGKSFSFNHRGTELELIDFSEQDLKPMASLWTAHLKNLGPAIETLNLPTNIQNAIAEINQILIKTDNNQVFK